MRRILRWALVLVSLVYLVFVFYLIPDGEEPFPFAGYLPIYCFLFIQVPATAVLLVLHWRKKPDSEKNQTDLYFCLGGFGMVLLYSMLVLLLAY